jgi:rhodanese-related sulfurtransferase
MPAFGLRIYHPKATRIYPKFLYKSKAYGYRCFCHEYLTTLYWTIERQLRKVRCIMQKIILLFAASLSCLLGVSAHAGSAGVVSADDAHTALVQGAFVVDVRSQQAFAQGHLLQAASLPHDAAQLSLPGLAALLSQAGIDSSRTVLVVGEAGDANAQALWQRLAQVSSGRVLWLVGGVQEWQMRGHVLTTQLASRLPVPQFLAPFDAPANASRMAGSKVRTSALLERDLTIKVALN